MSISGGMKVQSIVEAEWPFEDENDPDWKWCVERATFKHRDADACEFIVHVGDEGYSDNIITEMEQAGCTSGFIDLYKEAVSLGAIRILFYS